MHANNQRSRDAINTMQALTIIGRAMRYSLRYKFELTVKVTAQMTSIFWLLFLPWPAKIVVDYIVLGDSIPADGAVKPFFFEPLLVLVENLTPYQTAWFMGALFLLMILLIGAFGTEGAERDLATAGLAEGEDTATRSENQANVMHSLVSGMFGLFEALWHIRITHRLNHHLRSELFKRFAAHSVTDFDDRSVGDVVYRAMYDTPAISNVIFNLWVGPATSAINLTTTILLMYVVFRSEPAVVWGYYNAIAASSGYLGRLWLSIQENVTGLDRVFTILDSPVEAIEVAPESTSLGSDFRLQQGIRLQDVDFDYPDGTSALRGINFEGRLGEMIALTGPTGAGKSTLAYLVPGLLTPKRGQYYVDNHLLTANDLTPLRQQVSLVFQEASLFFRHRRARFAARYPRTRPLQAGQGSPCPSTSSA